MKFGCNHSPSEGVHVIFHKNVLVLAPSHRLLMLVLKQGLFENQVLNREKMDLNPASKQQTRGFS